MENQWLSWAKQVQAIASTGLHFSKDEYDKERYDEIQRIACSMLCSIGNVPLQRIENLVSDSAQGYVTPKVDVRGAIIKDDKVLLVREKADGLWALPGGFADVGLSPSENILKEIREEAGIEAEIVGLYSIRHKAKQSYKPDLRDFYKLFFVCQQIDDADPVAGAEAIEIGLFPLDSLPQLSQGRVIKSDIEAAFAFVKDRTAITVD